MEQSRSVLRSIGFGALVGMIVFLALCLVSASVISSGRVSMEALPILGVVILTIAVLLGAITGARLQGGKTLITALGAGGATLGVMILMKAAFFAGWSSLALWGVIASAAAAILAALLPAGKVHRRRKH